MFKLGLPKVIIVLLSLSLAVFAYAQPNYIDDSGELYEQENKTSDYDNVISTNNTVFDLQAVTSFTDYDIPPTRTAVIVTQVVSGNIIVVNNYGVDVGVRLQEVEIAEPNTLNASPCKDYLQNLIEGKAVTLEHDDNRDEDGYLLATVYFSTKNLSVQMQEFIESLDD